MYCNMLQYDGMNKQKGLSFDKQKTHVKTGSKNQYKYWGTNHALCSTTQCHGTFSAFCMVVIMYVQLH